jgi:YesN/AraC family two-component response regulator
MDLARWRSYNDIRRDLLITAVIMPGGMYGAELVQRLRPLIPGIKIIYCSGFSALLWRSVAWRWSMAHS